ncbi:integral membrane protein [Aspergillus leporis]|uniref:Integral membrane protein n=1 Tax=Aspergillus leporis TaxID=41062 RepID=A0A5N5XB80_9EURO|nr:integral membrane protein [Aspergillus leporis]
MSVENTYWKNVLTVVPIVGAAVATLSYILRLVSCRISTIGLRLEDFLMGIGLILSYCATAFVIYTAFNGVGVRTSLLPPDERHRIQFGSWMIQKFWAPSMAFVKISIIVFLQRILGTITSFRVVSNCLIIFIALWAVVALLVNIFQCNPVQFYYDKTLKDGHCMHGQTKFFQAMGSIALVEDVTILLLPVPIVWRLKITTRQKIAVTIVFSLGGLVCIFSLMRLIEFRNFQVTDLASSSAKESIWTVLELDVAIICGCLPLLKPLLAGFLGTVKSISKGQSNVTSGTKLYFPTSGTHHNDGFHKIGDPHGALGSQSREVATQSTRRGSSEIELHGIEVHTAIESRSEVAHSDTEPRAWP